jgi:hypothetical protein
MPSAHILQLRVMVNTPYPTTRITVDAWGVP